MKNLIGILLLFLSLTFLHSQNVSGQTTLAGWDFNGLPGGTNNFGPSPMNASTTGSNLTIGGLTRGAGIGTTGSGATNGWGGNDMITNSEANAISGNDFITFTVTANSGFTVSINSINAYNVRRSGTGSSTGQWQYRIGAGSFVDIGTDITWGAVTTAAGNSKPAINLSGVSDLQNVSAGTTITFRCVLWGGSGAAGTWYLNQFQAGNDFVVDGTVSSAGEPVLSADPSSLSGFTYVVGSGPSASQSYVLTGEDLETDGARTDDFLIKVDALDNYEISLNDVLFEDELEVEYESDGTLEPTTIYVRLKAGLPSGDYNDDDIIHLGGGADPMYVTLSGSVTEPVVEGWQIAALNTRYLIDFDNTVNGVNNGQFQGTGFTSSPTSGRLNSEAWAMTGWTDGNLSFGDSRTTGDYARGVSIGGVTTGGVYAFTVGIGTNSLGFQPGGGDWAPGTVTLRAQNQTGSTITSVLVSYKVDVFNDQNRSSSFNFSYSSNNSDYTDVSALNLTSPAAADVSPEWVANVRTVRITGLNIAAGNYFYMRWSGADVAGSGSRDEFGLDDIEIVANPSGITPVISGNVGSMILSGDVALNGNAEIEDLVLNPEGRIIVGSNTLTLSGPINFNGGGISGTNSGGTSTSNIVINGSGTITGNAMFTGPSYFNNFSTNRNLTLGNNLFVRGALTVNNANVTFNDRTLSLNGDVNFIGTGRISSSSFGSYLEIIGTGNDFSLPDMNLRQLSMSRTGAVNLAGTVTIDKRVNLYRGSLTGGEFLTLRDYVLIDKTNGTLTGEYILTNKVKIKYSGSGSVIQTGAEIPADPTLVDDMEFNNANGVTLNSDIYFFRKDPVVNAPVNVNGNAVTLRSGAFGFGPSGYFHGTSGEIVYNLSTTSLPPVPSINIGGLGLVVDLFSRSRTLKNFTLTRGFSPQDVNSSEGIFRYYQYSAPANYNSNLNATIVFNYRDDELNGNDEMSLELYHSTDGGTTWVLVPGVQVLDPDANTITVPGLYSIPAMLTAVGDPLLAGAEGDKKDVAKKDQKGLSNETEAGAAPEAMPEEFGINQNYPNPFNPVTSVKFALPSDDFVSLKIYDITGREITELVNEFKSAGYHTVQFDGTTLSSGVYFYRIITGSGFNRIMKMTLIK